MNDFLILLNIYPTLAKRCGIFRIFAVVKTNNDMIRFTIYTYLFKPINEPQEPDMFSPEVKVGGIE